MSHNLIPQLLGHGTSIAAHYADIYCFTIRALIYAMYTPFLTNNER